MRHGWSVSTMTCCYRLYGLSLFSNWHAVLRKLWVWQQKRKFGIVMNISLTQKYGNYEKLENIKTWQWKIENLGIIHWAIKSAARKARHHFTASQLHRWSQASLILLQHAASQQCLSKTSNTLFLSEKEKLFNTKAMVTCKRSAAVVTKLTNYEHLALSKTKKQTQVASGLHKPYALCCCHGKHIESTVPTDSQVKTKKKLSRWTTAWHVPAMLFI